MPNHYSQSSFIIELTTEQTQAAIEAFEKLKDPIFEEQGTAREVASQIIDESADATTRIISHTVKNHPDIGCEDLEYLDFGFSVEADENGLCIFGEDSFDSDHAAVFAQAILKTFGLPDLVLFEVAHSCSRPLPDSFGGHSVAVTKDSIRFNGALVFREAEYVAHQEQCRYFFCKVKEVNGDIDYDVKFLMRVGHDQDKDEAFADIVANFRDDNATLSEGPTAENSDGTLVTGLSMTEIEPIEFHTMKKYLSVL